MPPTKNKSDYEHVSSILHFLVFILWKTAVPFFQQFSSDRNTWDKIEIKTPNRYGTPNVDNIDKLVT